MPVELKRKIDRAVAVKVANNEEGSVTKEVVSRLELSFDLTRADGYNHGYTDATAHLTFAVTAALAEKGLAIDDIQSIIDQTMSNFNKNA